MPQIIGSLRGNNLEDAWKMARSIKFAKTTHSSYAPLREEIWYRMGSNLQSLKAGRHKIFAYTDPHPRLVQLGDRYKSGWHSLLACSGNQKLGTSSTIEWHRDHGSFLAMALMLNLGEAIYWEEDPKGTDEFELEDYDLKTGQRILRKFKATPHHLTDGMLLNINTKKLHKSVQLSDERYNFTYRCFKPEFLK